MIFVLGGAESVDTIQTEDSPHDLIDELKEIVEDRDATSLYNLINVDKGVYWTPNEAENVIELLNTDHEKYKDLLFMLRKQAELLENGEDFQYDSGFFYFNESGKLNVRGYHFILPANTYEEVNHLLIEINDSEIIEMSDEKFNEDVDVDLGLFGPGLYNISFVMDYPFSKVSKEIDIEVFNFAEFEKKLQTNLQGEMITVTSSISETNIQINDTEVDLMLQEYEKLDVGPVANGVNVRGTLNFPWGELLSDNIIIGTTQPSTDQYQVKEHYELTPHIIEDEINKYEISQLLSDFYEQLFQSFHKNDSSLLKNNNVSDEIKEKYKEYIENNSSNNIGEYYERDLYSTVIDFSCITLENEQETNEDLFTLEVRLYFKPNDNSDEVIKYMKKSVSLKYDNSKWIIQLDKGSTFFTDDSFDVNDNNIVEVVI